jgi:phosphoenolpyruvate carboxykinase (GTP)
VGIVPDPAELDLTGLEIAPSQLRQALAIDPAEWSAELNSAGEFFDKIGPALPQPLREMHRELAAALAHGDAAERKAV